MIADSCITTECPTTDYMSTPSEPTSITGSPAAESTLESIQFPAVTQTESASVLIPIIATLASVIILLLFVLIVGGIVVVIAKKVLRKRRIKGTDGRVKYISSEGGHLTTDDCYRDSHGFDNQVVSFHITPSLC